MKLSEMNKYIKIDVPVDLRNYFKSSSCMNFFSLTTISYKFNSKEDAKKCFEVIYGSDISNKINDKIIEHKIIVFKYTTK